MISIIIPVLNEESTLLRNQYFEQLSRRAELIFVDGGSEDRTREVAARYGRLLVSPKGRSIQMNSGAGCACHDILFFLHADCYIRPEVLEKIEQMTRDNSCVGGCLRQVIDAPGLLFKWIAWTGNIRAKWFKIFYGDQGIFVRRDIFEKSGGFPDVQMCEDIFFSRRLKKLGKVGLLSCPVYTSPRRWLQQGIPKTFLFNIRVMFALTLGQDLNRLASLYKDVR